MRSLNNISKNKSSMVFNYEDIYCCFVFIVIYLKSIFSSFADQIYNIFFDFYLFLFIFFKIIESKIYPYSTILFISVGKPFNIKCFDF